MGTGTVALGNATTFLHQKSIAASTSVQIPLEDPIYLLEGESIKAAVVGTGGGGGNINIMFGYEEIS